MISLEAYTNTILSKSPRPYYNNLLDVLKYLVSIFGPVSTKNGRFPPGHEKDGVTFCLCTVYKMMKSCRLLRQVMLQYRYIERSSDYEKVNYRTDS